MLSIRLRRMGKKKQPIYRVIVLDKRKDPWGDYLVNLGTYNPRTKPNTVNLKTDRIKYWLGVGAQPSVTLHNLFIDEKIIDAKKIKATSPKKKEKEEGEESKEAPKTEESKQEAKEDVKSEDKPATEEKKEEKKEEKPAENK